MILPLSSSVDYNFSSPHVKSSLACVTPLEEARFLERMWFKPDQVQLFSSPHHSEKHPVSHVQPGKPKLSNAGAGAVEHAQGSPRGPARGGEDGRVQLMDQGLSGLGQSHRMRGIFLQRRGQKRLLSAICHPAAVRHHRGDERIWAGGPSAAHPLRDPHERVQVAVGVSQIMMLGRVQC